MRDVNKRLQSLNARRTGSDSSYATFDSVSGKEVTAALREAYVDRAPAKEHTQYALGAMQEVDENYTRISLEEAERVKAQLKDGLDKVGLDASFRLQGSVACGIHIRRYSDIDLLVLETRYIHYDSDGVRAKRGGYNNPVSYDTLQALITFRSEAERILSKANPAATVNVKGAKSINVSGGLFRRSVDVVPSNWHDTKEYQETGLESDRGVYILNKDVPSRLLNLPFKHIQRINERDQESLGGLKKAIRLCKSVKEDAVEEGTPIKLSSYDIAATLWHANIGALTVGVVNELAILAEATRYLNYLVQNPTYAATLNVPDGSRKIFDTAERKEGLVLLSLELDDLTEKVYREQTGTHGTIALSRDQVTNRLRSIAL